MRRSFLILCNLIFHSLFAQQVLDVNGGQLLRYELPFDAQRTRTIEVFIPTGTVLNRHTKTLYMHDGQMLFDSTRTWNKKEWCVDEVCSQQLSRFDLPNFIVVGIYNDPENRYAEFFPQALSSYMPATYRDKLMGALWNGQLRADHYLNWIEDTLVPFIEKTQHVSKKTKDRMVMGSSMGGLISLYALCEKPKLFGAAACLSIHTPMINFNMFEEGMIEALVLPFNMYLAETLKADKKHYLYIDRGTENLDGTYKPYHDQLLKTLAEIGYTARNPHFLQAIVQGAGHDEVAWSKRWQVPFMFMLMRAN
jgi:hypothetical protein